MYIYHLNHILFVAILIFSTCSNGVMTCDSKPDSEVCKSPMVFYDCSSLPKGSTGVACLPTCKDNKVFCKSEVEHCVSGCGCPEGTVFGNLKLSH